MLTFVVAPISADDPVPGPIPCRSRSAQGLLPSSGRPESPGRRGPEEEIRRVLQGLLGQLEVVPGAGLLLARLAQLGLSLLARLGFDHQSLRWEGEREGRREGGREGGSDRKANTNASPGVGSGSGMCVGPEGRSDIEIDMCRTLSKSNRSNQILPLLTKICWKNNGCCRRRT